MGKITLGAMLLFWGMAQSQLFIDNTTMNPAQLVQNVLVGQGVTPYNIQFNRSAAAALSVSDQAAHFQTQTVPTNLGIDEGLLMTTGKSIVAMGPNNQGSATSPPDSPVTGDVDLQQLVMSGTPIDNICVIEFDFVATGLELNFDFVFASEEWPVFANSSYNDVFGFFLSGSGISGPYSNGAKNIALIPASSPPYVPNTAVSINNVNNGNTFTGPCEHCDIFTNNTGGTSIQYNGFTHVIRATSVLDCGAVYHIKLAIANVSDSQLDSGVFLKNFRIVPMEIVDNYGSNENLTVCDGEKLTLSTSMPPGTYLYQWSTGGAPILGANGPTLSVTEDGIYHIEITTPAGCVLASDDFEVRYLPPIPIALPQDISLCPPPASGPYTFPNIGQTTNILNGLDPSLYPIYYYDSSLVDINALTGIGELSPTDLLNYTTSTLPKIIYVRVIDLLSPTGCSVTKTFELGLGTPPPVTAPVSYCQNEAAVPLTATGAGLLWYNALTGGTALATAPTPGTTVTGNTTYYVSQTIGTCESVRTPLTVSVTPAPSAPAVTSPVSYCLNETSAPLTATGSNLLWYSSATGGVGSPVAPTPGTTLASSTSYYVTQSTGCESPRSQIIVNVGSTVPPPNVTTPVTYCEGNPSAALTATGSNLLWYTTPVGGFGNPVAPVPATMAAGSTTYFVTQTIGTCESPRTSITVDVTARPPAPTTAPLTYCQNDSASPLTATGTGLLWYISATSPAGSPTAPTPSTAAGAVMTYFVTQTVNGCESPRAPLTVTVTARPAAPVAATPINYCQNETATSLIASGTSLLWYTTSSGGTGSPVAPTPITTTAGSQIFYVTQSNGCESARTLITVNVFANPSAPVVVTPLNYCQGTSAIPLTASGSNLLWYATASGGTGSATAPSPLTTSAGSTTYYVSQKIGNCESARSQISVNILARPAMPATAALQYCIGDGALPLSATGTNLTWYNLASGGTGSPAAPLPSTSVAGTTTYYVSQEVAGCESLRASLPVTVTAPPPAPVANTPIVYCQGSTATALTSGGSNLLWYTSAVGGTGSPSAPVPSTISSGGTSYYVTQSNGCESARSQIVVNVINIPAAPTVVTPVIYCQGTTSLPLSASGSNLIWYTSPISGPGSPSVPSPSTAAPGSTMYYVTQNNGTCESARAGITVNVIPRPAAPATSPVVYCIGEAPAPLSVSGSGLLWYGSAAGGIGSPAIPTPSTTTAGITDYYVTQTISGCESLRALLRVTVASPPAAPVVSSPISYCQNIAGPPLTAIGAGLLWYTSPVGGTGTAIAPIPSTNSVGSTTYYVSQNNGCESPRAPIVVNVIISLPAPVVTTPLNYCQNTLPAALSATGSNLKWYTSPVGGTAGTIAPTPSTTASGTTVFYVSQSTGTCESPRAPITVNILPLPTAPAVTPLNYCKNEIATQLNASGSNLLWYNAPAGGTGNPVAPTPLTGTPGVTTFYVSQTVNSCEGPRAGLPVTVNAPPAAPAVQSPVVYCQDDSAALLSAVGTNLKWYLTPSGGTGSNVAPIPSTASGGSMSYYVSQNNGCEGPRARIVVNVTPTPSAPSVTTPVNYCEGDITSALTAGGTNLLWYTSATGGTGISAAPIPDATVTGNKTYYVSQRTGNCESPRAAIVVQVNSIPDPKLQQNGIICYNSLTNTAISTFTLDTGLIGSQYQFEWFVNSGGAWNTILGADQQTYEVTAPGTYGVRATINGICPSDIVSATVGMSSPPLEIKLVTSNYFEDSQMITVNVYPSGTYLYQIDNGAFQNSNIFTNLPAGTHQVTVKNDCGEIGPMEAVLINYPKYFTPNGDGYNDTWNIFSLRSQPNAKIYIFDRYGKFLKEITPNGIGWDGSFNQQNLPATDYWFQVYYEENSASKVFKSHFALKR